MKRVLIATALLLPLPALAQQQRPAPTDVRMPVSIMEQVVAFLQGGGTYQSGIALAKTVAQVAQADFERQQAEAPKVTGRQEQMVPAPNKESP